MALLGLASAITGFVKVRFLEDKEVIETTIFRLHSRVTCAMLFLACALCTATALIGDPIACIGTGDKDKWEKPLNTYCWISSTFTLPDYYDKSPEESPHPGIGPYVPGKHEQKFHSYYQWVPFVLLFQGILFYLPHWLWKTLEQKKIHIISNGLRGTKVDASSAHGSVEQLSDYLVETRRCNFIYSYGYILCEILNLINVVGNVFLIDRMLGGAFMKYGTEVISFSNTDQMYRTDPMVKIFPRVTKCIFKSYGSSGTMESRDLMCVMAINVINEKIYIFLWFWLFVLCGFSIFAVLYSIFLMLVPDWRAVMMRRKFKCRSEAEFLARNLSFGDFMLLTFLSYNIEASLFNYLMRKMCSRLDYGEKKNYA